MIALVWILIIYSVYFHSNACQIRHANKPLAALRCVTSTTTEIRQIARPQCVWRCLRMKTCRYINYNFDSGHCELGFSECETLQPTPGVMVTVFGPPRHGCLHWGSSQESGFVPVEARDGVIYVARTLISDDVIIGNLFTNNGELWANRDGVRIGPITGTDVEILTKDEACHLPWMPYTAGEPFPFGAVMGGRLADGSVIYVAKINNRDYSFFGYYHPISVLAYYERSGAQTTTSMDLLVLL